MYDSEMPPRPEERAPRWGQQPSPDAGGGMQPRGRGIDWGAIMQRLQQRHQQRFPQWGGHQGMPQGAPQAAPQAPVGTPPAAPAFDRERLMSVAQGFGRPQQPGGIVPPNWRGAQY